MNDQVIEKLIEIVEMESFDDIYDDDMKLAKILLSKGIPYSLEVIDLLTDLRIIYSNIKEALKINKEIAKKVWDHLSRD